MGKLADSKVMVHLCVSKDVDKRLAELAERMELSKAAFGGMLLDAGLEDNDFIIRAATHPAVKRVMKAIRGKAPSSIEIKTDVEGAPEGA